MAVPCADELQSAGIRECSGAREVERIDFETVQLVREVARQGHVLDHDRCLVHTAEQEPAGLARRVLARLAHELGLELADSQSGRIHTLR